MAQIEESKFTNMRHFGMDIFRIRPSGKPAKNYVFFGVLVLLHPTYKTFSFDVSFAVRRK